MGFKTEQFVKKVDENLICGICLEVLEDPWQCKDGHTFCKYCITRCLETRQRCPLGNNVLQFDNLARCLGMKNMIENLVVYCDPPESDRQTEAKEDAEEYKLKCDWTGKLQSLAKHREHCLFQKVRCPNVNCDTKMQRRELEAHDKKCEYKVVTCQKCRNVMVRGMLEWHNFDNCPEGFVPCPKHCRCPETGKIYKIKRINLDYHMENECAKTILDCPFEDQGCSVQVERQHVDKHVQDNIAAHMILLAKQCSSLTEQMRSMAKENEQLKEELNEVKKKDEFSRTYTWRIKNYRNIRRPSIESPTFWLCGYSWHLEVYLKNEVSVHLCLDKAKNVLRNTKIAVLCRLTVPSFRSDIDDLSLEKLHVFCLLTGCEQLKWDGFMTANNAISPEYCDEGGNLIMKCTIQIDCEKRDIDSSDELADSARYEPDKLTQLKEFESVLY